MTHLDAVQAFAATHPAEARKIFNELLAQETNPERIAKIEFQREWMCSPSFRSTVGDMVAEINGV